MAPRDENEHETALTEIASAGGRLGMQPKKRASGLRMRLAQVKSGYKKPSPSGRTTRPTPSLPTMPWDKKAD